MQGDLGQLIVSGSPQPALYREVWSGPTPARYPNTDHKGL